MFSLSWVAPLKDGATGLHLTRHISKDRSLQRSYPQSEMRVSFRWSLCILRREPEVRATSSVHNGTPHRDHTGLVAAEARLGERGRLESVPRW